MGRIAFGTFPTLLSAVALVLSAGCATDRQISLVYTPTPTQDAPRISPGPIYVAPVEDVRKDPDVAGEIGQGLFKSTVRPDTEIRHPDTSAAEWVHGAVVSELKAKGGEVVASPEAAMWQINGVILEMSYHEGGWPVALRPGAVMTVGFQLTNDGRIVLNDQYWKSCSVKVPEGESPDPAAIYEVVLRRVLADFFGDLHTALLGNGTGRPAP